MDKETRNRIQRATQDARTLLEREYAEQLEGVFDIRLDGTIATAPGEHLDVTQKVLRTKLVAAVEHVASQQSAVRSRQEVRAADRRLQTADCELTADSVPSYLREAAFTTLNRFVALKMLEARGLVQECISRGDQSAGFKEFTGLAPGLVQLPDHGYRIYIEALFDEIGREVGILFDRRDPASLLWPRRQALQDLFTILNDLSLAQLPPSEEKLPTADRRPPTTWSLDETIGWVYQYFNSDDERRQMRAESQAPRSSRELAVRNQFFTPRYVVQFLTDNTLGRIWCEMRRGDTKLRDLDYLVRRPNEVFLREGEEPPPDAEAGGEDLTQEELLRRPVHVPFRAKKDPRDIRVLDPACGSGHFLLYAFDLQLTIYDEAWGDETSPASGVTGRSLREDYPDLESLRSAAPGLILRYNLYGIDIDARCAQIAALALWMRAQRAFNDFGIPRGARRAIRKTNIVVAEPMPGERDLRREFVGTLGQNLRQLVERVFDRMELAGEAGSLLRIEEDIRDAVREVYGQHGDLFRASDEERWRNAEEEVLDALRAYAEHATNGRAYQRRLFAEDAARGLGFIDLCRQRYDAVLMNPPFGDMPDRTNRYVGQGWPVGKDDIGTAMVLRARQVSTDHGFVGAITNRTFLAIPTAESWRLDCLLYQHSGLTVLADLGYGVLDGAMVEAACYVVASVSDSSAVCFDMLQTGNKAADLAEAIDATRQGTLVRRAAQHRLSVFRRFPTSVICHWLPPRFLSHLESSTNVGEVFGEPKRGLNTGDDFRFVRLAWEIPVAELGAGDKRWGLLSKGGEYAPYYDDLHLVLNWAAVRREMRLLSGARIFGEDLSFKPAVVYPMRTTSDLSPRPLAANACYNVASQYLEAPNLTLAKAFIALSYTRVFKALVEAVYGSGDASVAGSAARNYTGGVLARLPLPHVSDEQAMQLAELYDGASRLAARLKETDETSLLFASPFEEDVRAESLSALAAARLGRRFRLILSLGEKALAIDQVATQLYELDSRVIDSVWGPHPFSYSREFPNDEESRSRLADLCERTVGDNWTVPDGSEVPARILTKKSYFADRLVEVIAHCVNSSPASIVRALIENPAVMEAERRSMVGDLVSYGVGRAFGRWQGRRYSTVADWDALGELPTPSTGVPRRLTQRVLVDDPGHPDNIVSVVERKLAEVLPALNDLADAVARNLDHSSLRNALRDWFFPSHAQRYGRSRRKAPVYWQLATPSASYSVWFYYHRFTKDTLYRVLNDYVGPKLQHEERKLAGLMQSVDGNPPAGQRKEIAEQETFVEDLRMLREEVARVAPLWKPDLNDGVIINFAPLWRLVPQHKSWQKECKACWEKLCKGDYDWAHLAMHLWPERVVPKCAEDRSLAIAHGLEDEFWYEDSDGKWQPRKVDHAAIDKLIEERTSAAIKDDLKSQLEAPAPSGSRVRGEGFGRKRKGHRSASGGGRRRRRASEGRLTERPE